MHEDEETRVYYLAASTALLRQVPGPTSCEPTEMSMETRGMSGTATAAKHPVLSLRPHYFRRQTHMLRPPDTNELHPQSLDA